MTQVGKRASRVQVNVGDRHKSLTVLEHMWHTQPGGQTVRALKCQCDCGNTTVVVIYDWGKRRSGCSQCGAKRGRHNGRTTQFASSTYLSILRKDAEKRGIEVDLTAPEYAFVVSKPCHYCKAEASGVDRVDSNGAYTMANVVPCCYSCNKAKSIMTIDEFAAWVTRVYAHLTKTKWNAQYVAPVQRLFGD